MTKINRRQFLERAALLGAGLGAGALMIGCQSGGGGGGLTCTDTSGLAEADIQLRNTSAYTDSSPEAGKHCSNCSLYTAGAEGECGSCTVLKGPVHPDGYCNLWAAQA